MSENVLVWAKRNEVQKAQSTVMSSITEAKEFDKIKTAKNVCKDSLQRSTDKNADEADKQVLWKKPSPETMPGIWEDV